MKIQLDSAIFHKFYFLTIILLLFFPPTIFSQSLPFKDYKEASIYKGDFNGDKQLDKIVVYEKKCDSLDDSFLEDATCRRIAIFLKIKGNFKLYGYNDNLIDCSQCGGAGVGDPFQNITIKKQYFSVESLYGACDKTFIVTTFKFDITSNEFYLYKIGTEDYSCNDVENSNGEIISRIETKTQKDFGKIKFINYK